jgi:hypothetical protein
MEKSLAVVVVTPVGAMREGTAGVKTIRAVVAVSAKPEVIISPDAERSLNAGRYLWHRSHSF